MSWKNLSLSFQRSLQIEEYPARTKPVLILKPKQILKISREFLLKRSFEGYYKEGEKRAYDY